MNRTTNQPPSPPFDRGSNDRRFPTFGAGVFANQPTVTTDSIGGADSDDWWAITVSYTRIGDRLPVIFNLIGANAGFEVYSQGSSLPLDRRVMPGQSPKEMELYLVRGTYLIHVIPLSTTSVASNYRLTVKDKLAMP